MFAKLLLGLTLLLGITLSPFGSVQAAYPEKPVRIVVGFSPGGGTDLVGRLIAERLAGSLGRTFVVENKPGAGAMIGAEFVAKAAPDGYTLLLGTSAELTISPPLYGRAPYNPDADFSPIAMLGVSPAILLANKNFPAKDIRDVVTQAKNSPGKLNIATGGSGTAPDLAAHQLKTVADIDFVIVPYKGAAPSQTDAIAGHVPLVFSTVASALPFIQNKDLNPLAIIFDRRSSLLPDVPSAAELGLKNYSVVTWFGLFAPAGTPPNVIAALRGAVQTALEDKALQERFTALGIEPAPSSANSETLASRIKTELAHWTKVIQTAGIGLK